MTHSKKKQRAKKQDEPSRWRGTLDEVRRQCWGLLVKGAYKAYDPFHLPVIGSLSHTSGASFASLRTVVLREAISAQRVLLCHSDVRAAKVEELQQNNLMSWHFYHPKQRVQLRALGAVSLHTDDQLADEQWAQLSPGARKTYCVQTPPGSIVEAPGSFLPDAWEGRAPTEAESEAGRPYFCALRCEIAQMEWLWLGRGDHRRAQFVWEEDSWQGNWLVP